MRALMLFLVLVSLGLAGCTESNPTPEDAQPDGDDTAMDDPGSAPAESIAIAATGVYPVNPALTPATFTVASGTMLTVTYTNSDVNPVIGHDLRISGVDEQTPNLANGESAELTFLVDLPPGEYPYWCTIGSHREQGMEGVMIVT